MYWTLEEKEGKGKVKVVFPVYAIKAYVWVEV
jgi:hypothetical protein